MSGPFSPSPSRPPAASSFGGGCLSWYLLPPLAAVFLGVVLAFLTLGPYTLNTTAQISTPGGTALGGQGGASVSSVFTPEVQYWSPKILSWAAAAGVDPNLVATVMQIESCGDPLARSSAGAMGLFQVMPYHFVPGEDPYDPDTNALRGLDYLYRSLQAARGDPHLTLAGYNGGLGVIQLPEFAWKGETRLYAARGRAIYLDASAGSNPSPHLQEWLAASGASLCRQAHLRLGINP